MGSKSSVQINKELEQAIIGLNQKKASKLIKRKFDLTQCHNNLLLAAKNRMEQVALELLNKARLNLQVNEYKTLINKCDKQGLTVLMHACKNRLINLATVLLDGNNPSTVKNITVDVNKTDDHKNSAFTYACENKLDVICQLIVMNGFSLSNNVHVLMNACLNRLTKTTETIIETVIKNRNDNLNNYLRTIANGGNNTLLLAVNSDLDSISKIIIPHSTKEILDIRNNQGETALLISATKGKLNLCDLLVQYGADTNIKNVNGITAAELIKRLKQREVKQNDQDENLCVICLTEKKDIMNEPCRHICLCHNCEKGINECPMCRSHISAKKKVFL